MLQHFFHTLFFCVVVCVLFCLFSLNILHCPLVLNQPTAAPINKIDISKLSRDRCETSFLLVASPLFITVNYHGSSIDRTRRLFWTWINLACELFHLRINSKLICKREVWSCVVCDMFLAASNISRSPVLIQICPGTWGEAKRSWILRHCFLDPLAW